MNCYEHKLKTVKAIAQAAFHQHRLGTLPRLLAEQRADAVVAGSIGRLALLIFAKAEIEIHLGGQDQAETFQIARASSEGEMPHATLENSRCTVHHDEHDTHCH